MPKIPEFMNSHMQIKVEHGKQKQFLDRTRLMNESWRAGVKAVHAALAAPSAGAPASTTYTAAALAASVVAVAVVAAQFCY